MKFYPHEGGSVSGDGGCGGGTGAGWWGRWVGVCVAGKGGGVLEA